MSSNVTFGPNLLTMGNAKTEQQLIDEAKQGDQAALGQLLVDAYDDLAAFLTPRIPAAAQRMISVEDVIQQVYSRAFHEIERFEYRGEGSFRAWLRSIGDFRLRDAVKKLQRMKRGGDRALIEQGNRQDSESFLDVVATIAGDDPTASRVLRHQEARAAMQLAIAELPDDYREVIYLRFFELKSIEETSSMMNRSQASVRALTDRAKKQLRDALGRISAYLSTRGY